MESEWEESLAAYEKKYPTEAAEFKSLISLKLPEGWEKALPVSLYLWNLFLCKTAKPHCFSCSFSLMLCVLSVDDFSVHGLWLEECLVMLVVCSVLFSKGHALKVCHVSLSSSSLLVWCFSVFHFFLSLFMLGFFGLVLFLCFVQLPNIMAESSYCC